jgi:nucleoid DNA-binding protein
MIDTAAETAFKALITKGSARLPGLGELVVRETRAFKGKDPRTGKTVSVPAKRLPSLVIDMAARTYVNQGGRPPTGAFSAAVEQAARGDRVVLGALGRLRVVRKPEAERAGVVVPARAVMSLQWSRTLNRTLAGERPETIPEAAVTTWLATPFDVKVPRQLATYLKRELPQIGLSDETAQAEHEALCELRDLTSGTVFATISDGETAPEDRDHWAIMSKSADPLVARTQGPRKPEVRLSAWLRATTALTALSDLAKDRVLAPADARRVLAHVDAMAPGVADVWDSLPY